MSSTDFEIRNLRQNVYGAQDDRPLTEQEFQLLQRLLSDPFSFPLQFKSWLVSYLETSDMSLPMSSVSGLQKTLGITGAGSGTLGTLPAGLIFPYGGQTAPTGSKMCDGAAYPTATEDRLFKAIGYAFGGGGASFNVPDLRERIPVGKGSIGYHNTLGQNDGMSLGQRGTKHNHTVSPNPHAHTIPSQSDGATSGTNTLVSSDHGSDHTEGSNATSLSVGPGGTPTDGPAFVVINFIIIA